MLSTLYGGADVNLITPYGQTILMEAVDDGLTEIVKFLLEAGADPNIADEVLMDLVFGFAIYLV
jgi:ankyrin repeat protein